MKLKYIPIFIIVLLVYGLLNYYIGGTIFKSVRNFIPLKQGWFSIFFVIIALSYVISMLFSKFLPSALNNPLQLVGSYWMAFFMYALIIFPLIGLINIILGRFNLNSDVLVKITLIEILITTIFFMFIGILGSFNANGSYVNSFNISAREDSLDKQLNIVMVSDLHLGNLIGNKKLSKMVSEINYLKPDVVIIAGDIVDSDITPFIKNNMASEFSKIESTYGTYATLGNHDLMTRSEEKLQSELENNKVKLLRDESILIDNTFYIIGRDDISINRFNNSRSSLDSITHSLDSSKFKIVIDHTPTSITESLNSSVDLHFSGHTHRGQLTPANLITKKLFEIDHGYLQKDNLHVLVSSGYGTWGPPIRIGSKSEIVNVIVN